MWLTFPSFNGFMSPAGARSAVMVSTPTVSLHTQCSFCITHVFLPGEHPARPHLRRRVCLRHIRLLEPRSFPHLRHRALYNRRRRRNLFHRQHARFPQCGHDHRRGAVRPKLHSPLSHIAVCSWEPWARASAIASCKKRCACSPLHILFCNSWQFKTFGFTDTCGVHNLHGIPGVIACVCGAIAVSNLDVKDGLPFSLNYLQVRLTAAAPSPCSNT